MKIKQGLLRSGYDGYRVVDLSTGRTVFVSAFKAECEQYIFVRQINCKN